MNHKYKNREYRGGYGFVDMGAVDEYDNPVKRTRSEYPYSYDGYVEWRGGHNSEITDTVYSDRLYQWDWEKYNRCRNEVYGNAGQYFDGYQEHDKIEKLLQLYMNEPKLKLILVMQYCNMSSGYPLWRFDYNIPKTETV